MTPVVDDRNSRLVFFLGTMTALWFEQQDIALVLLCVLAATRWSPVGRGDQKSRS